LVQALSIRLVRSLSVFKSLVVGFLGGAATLLSLEWSQPFSMLFLSFLTYTALSYIYSQAINVGEASIRIRILRELARAPQGLLIEEALREYSAATIIDYRVERLTKSGDIRFSNGRYYHQKAQMLWVAEVFKVLKLGILGRKWNDPLLNLKR
jgi:hypothetical protein